MSVYKPLTRLEGERYLAVVYIAGDYRMGIEAIKTWCDEHLDCWSVEPVDYVFTDGHETGLKATRIHYPRFPDETPEQIQERAEELAEYLLQALHHGGAAEVLVSYPPSAEQGA